jgi:hypothetical protein
MIASRYAAAVAALVAVTILPTLIHSYAGVVVDDGKRATHVPETLGAFTSQPTDRNPNWGRRHFDSDDWVERRYSTLTGSVTLSVVRSFDLKTLYHHPEIEIVEGADLRASRTETFAAHPDIPVFVLATERERGPVVFYALHYGDGFVRDPIWFQIRTAGELLFGGRQAMTLFMAQDSEVLAGADLSARPALALLYAAIEQFVDAGPQTSTP